jgi:predicted DsbA family dithiol-disulfide isomerase
LIDVEVHMSHIDVFADIMCPFTHVGLRRLREARAESSRKSSIRVRAWPLELINGEPIAAELAAREIAALRATVAPELFVGFDPETFARTSIPAFGLAASAYMINDTIGEQVSLAIRDALFEQGRDVGDPRVLVEIGEPFGLGPFPPSLALAAVHADWNRGRARGVKGSPHFFIGDRDWFCPSLRIRHDADDALVVEIARETMRDFYEAALL